MKKIFLGNDHPGLRSALKEIKGKYILHSFADTVVDERLFYEMVKKDEYSLIILAVNIPHTFAASVVKKTLDCKPQSRILMFSLHNEDEQMYAQEFLQMGAMGYISAAASDNEIKQAIESLLDNMRYISAAILEHITHDIFREKLPNPFERLSEREVDILKLMLKGKKFDSISQELKVEISTAETYKERILKKLNCQTLFDIKSIAGLYNFAMD